MIHKKQDEIGLTVNVHSQLLKLTVFTMYRVCYISSNDSLESCECVSRYRVQGNSRTAGCDSQRSGFPSALSLESVVLYCPQAEEERRI